MSVDEIEILEFYRGGASIKDLEYSYGYSGYLIKKFLAEEPALKEIGYIYRSLTEK